MRRKSAERSATSQWPCSGGGEGESHSISAFSSRQHVTQSPLGPRTQGEHVSINHGIFGPKSMLAFAPKCFKDKIGNENSAQSFSDRSFWKSLVVVDVRAFGSWMSAPKCFFFPRILTALTEALGRDIRTNDPRMSAGCPSQKLPLWADFSFLIKICEESAMRTSSLTPRAQRLKKLKILKFSSEIENFKRATHQTLFLWGFLKVEMKMFNRD